MAPAQAYAQVTDGLLLDHLLPFDPYPPQFHIANAATDDGTHSFYSDLMDATITKYKNIFAHRSVLDDQDFAKLVRKWQGRSSVQDHVLVSGKVHPCVRHNLDSRFPR